MEKLEELKLWLYDHKLPVMIGGGVLLIGVIILCLFCFLKEDTDHQEPLLSLVEETTEEDLVQEEVLCSVDIKGEVVEPGIYNINCSSRVHDAILEAQGLTNDADTSVLNLSKKVKDEMVIIVYSKEQVKNFTAVKETETKKNTACTTSGEVKNDACISTSDIVENTKNEQEIVQEEAEDTPVNSIISINTATKEELMTLPGIGESKASKIIQYRNEFGLFQTIEDLKKVSGIGDKVFEKLKSNITL